MQFELMADELWVEGTRKSDRSKKIVLMFGEYQADKIGDLKKFEGDDRHYRITIEIVD